LNNKNHQWNKRFCL